MRNQLDPSSALIFSTDIFARVKKLWIYEQAKIIMIYLSYGSEVITDFIVRTAIDEGKSVVVPVITTPSNTSMHAVRIASLEDANQLFYAVRQPEMAPGNVVAKGIIDLALIPGVAFDISGYRLGYGNGYYDRWLRDVPISKTVGLAYGFQVTDKLPIGKHDLPVGAIVTEQKIIRVIKN
jgi:5-formyltetrahydrofolate cyclo-ligase